MKENKTKKVIVLIPKRKKFAMFIRTVKLLNRFFGIESYGDMAFYYGVLLFLVGVGLFSIDYLVQMLFFWLTK
jgi:hypothetical protein